ncbi:hypothetical protein [Mesorhizobium sp. B2-3-4]|uniref:hypothetical protein n=1 Tax=Mesorhizobium sp. B2-3-4 TaxID=2589959 RepID=UPI0015E27A83|nr:hypothetical protein [Mesorhizobium sp. B2-3-4]
MQRKAAQFELMLALLKVVVGDAKARRPTPPEWLDKAEWAIARGEAIFAGARDPVESGDAKDLPSFPTTPAATFRRCFVPPATATSR